MSKSKPVQRSLKILRENGWLVTIVERYIKPPNMPFGKRHDAFGFGDLLACRPDMRVTCEPCFGTGKVWEQGRKYMQPCGPCKGTGKMLIAEKSIALVQCCRDADIAEHRKKILALAEYYTWKASGGVVFLQGWALKGPRGRAKRWTMREEML